MWAWTPDQLHRGQELERGDRLGRGARRDGEAELRVLLPRADELVRMRLDSGRHPDEDLGPDRCGGRRVQQASEAGDLVEGVDDDAADALVQRHSQFVRRLVVAVQHEAAGGHAGRERDVELTAGGDIEVHTLLVGQARHGSAQEGLGGVGDAFPQAATASRQAWRRWSSS